MPNIHSPPKDDDSNDDHILLEHKVLFGRGSILSTPTCATNKSLSIGNPSPYVKQEETTAGVGSQGNDNDPGWSHHHLMQTQL